MSRTAGNSPVEASFESLRGMADLSQIRAVVDCLPQLAWSCRPDGYCDYLSRPWVEFTGTPEAEHQGRGWLEAVHPDDRDRVRSVWDGFVSGIADYDVDYRLRRHDGAYRWFKTRGYLGKDQSGAPVRVFGATVDIDDQKRAEEQLRETQERLEAALAASGTGTYRWEIAADQLEWDERLDRLAGLPVGESVRSLEQFVSLVHYDDRPAVIENFARCRQTGADFSLEFRVVWPDGSVHWLNDRGKTFRDSLGRPSYVTGACVDITERKWTEERLREIDAREAFVRLASGVGFWYCDLPFDVLEWDDLVKDHFHLSPSAQVTIDTFFERIHPDDREATRAAIERSITNRTSYNVYYRTVHPTSGAEKWIRAIGRTSYASDGEPRRFDGITLDVTEQRLAENRQRFLADLSAATEPLVDPDAVTAVTARMLAEHLGTDRCSYAEVEDESVYVITGEYTRGALSIVGRWPVVAFGHEHRRVMLANEPYVVHDVDTDTRIAAVDRPAFRDTAIQAVICVPLHKEGRFTAAMAVHQATPRRWTPEEVELVRTVVGRCWEALERARAARLLKNSEEQLRLITDTAPALIAFVDADERCQFVNRQYEEWFDRPGNTFVGQRLADVFGSETYAQLRPFVERGLAGEGLEFEASATFPTGERHLLVAFVPRFEAGRVTGFLSFITDVTERVRAREAVRASERRFREMADTAPVALWLTEADGSCTFLSREWYDFTGQTEEEALGLGWTLATHPEDREPVGQDFLRASGAREPFRNEYRLQTRDGGYRWAIDSGRPRFGPNGEFLGMVGAVFDIEDRKQAETALKEADRKKDDFLALLAHELRNPLAPLRNGLQIMRLAGTSGEAAEQARAIMERQLGHMVRLIDDLLDISRISRNKMQLRPARVLLADIVTSAVETARPGLDAGGHEFTVSLPAEPVYLNADLTRLAQVFSNLLTNAAKYTPSGGKVRLAAYVRDSEVDVIVRDTGIGIPDASLANIFDMFSQVDRSIERSTGGLGIGLALVKGLVEMHGGRVSVASGGVDEGTTFTVTLPLEYTQPAPREIDTSHAGPVYHGPARRILVVDDNLDSAVSMAAMLEILGHQVRIAHDGLEAVAVAEAFRPALVLMDIGMPKLNGYDATRRIRDLPWGKPMTIVAVTGWGQDGDRIQSQAAGCDGHLVKPVQLGDVLPFVDQATAGD
jgi:PAS domain S-box-containing protein